MKKIFIIVCIIALVLAMTACSDKPKATGSPALSSAPTATSTPDTSAGPTGTTIGYYIATNDTASKAGLDTFKLLAAKEGWAVSEVVGSGTASKEIASVQQFISSKVAAIVVQSASTDTAGKSAVLANDAQIPIFFVGTLPDKKDGGKPDGYAGYDIKTIGSTVGEEMGKLGATKIIAIDGAASEADTMRAGFVEGYKKGANNSSFTDKSFVSKQAGKAQSSTAATVMATAITKTKNDFNAIFVGSDEMVPGVLEALENAGLTASSYIIGTAKGREGSWELIQNGEINFCVSQPPTLQADLVYQMVKAKLAGTEYKKFVNPYSQVLTKETIANGTIPWDPAEYVKKRDANGFVWDLANETIKEFTY